MVKKVKIFCENTRQEFIAQLVSWKKFLWLALFHIRTCFYDDPAEPFTILGCQVSEEKFLNIVGFNLPESEKPQ